MEIEGVAAVVVGGASGLGRAAAEGLAAQGAGVTILDLNEAKGREVAASLGGAFQHVDVTDEKSIAAALLRVEAAQGAARILVTCAGIAPVAQTIGPDGAAHDAGLFRKVIGVNLLGTGLMLASFAARLATVAPIGEERGVIINTASIAAFDGPSGQMAYSASKGGVAAMTLPAARDLARYRIRVMTIAPGMFRTPMVDRLTDVQKDTLGSLAPFPNRLGTPEEYARLVVSIVTNPMLNGEVIRLDGGHRL